MTKKSIDKIVILFCLLEVGILEIKGARLLYYVGHIAQISILVFSLA